LEARREIKRFCILEYEIKHFRIVGYETGAFLKKCVFYIIRAETLIFLSKYAYFVSYKIVFNYKIELFRILGYKILCKGILVTMGGPRVK
jgi:hypothetical protein